MNRILIAGMVAIVVALPLALWDSYQSKQELISFCDTHQGILVKQHKRTLCVRADSEIHP